MQGENADLNSYIGTKAQSAHPRKTLLFYEAQFPIMQKMLQTILLYGFQHSFGLGCYKHDKSCNSQQLVGESNPCFRRERAAS